MPRTSQKNRRSPSGPIADASLPIYGVNVLTQSLTRYLLVGTLGVSANLEDGEVGIAEPGKLRRLTVQHVLAGDAPSFDITYGVFKNGVLIPGATGTRANDSTELLELDVNTDVTGPDVGVVQDLIAVQVITPAFGGGTSPRVRTELLWAPGANF